MTSSKLSASQSRGNSYVAGHRRSENGRSGSVQPSQGSDCGMRMGSEGISRTRKRSKRHPVGTNSRNGLFLKRNSSLHLGVADGKPPKQARAKGIPKPPGKKAADAKKSGLASANAADQIAAGNAEGLVSPLPQNEPLALTSCRKARQEARSTSRTRGRHLDFSSEPVPPFGSLLDLADSNDLDTPADDEENRVPNAAQPICKETWLRPSIKPRPALNTNPLATRGSSTLAGQSYLPPVYGTGRVPSAKPAKSPSKVSAAPQAASKRTLADFQAVGHPASSLLSPPGNRVKSLRLEAGQNSCDRVPETPEPPGAEPAAEGDACPQGDFLPSEQAWEVDNDDERPAKRRALSGAANPSISAEAFSPLRDAVSRPLKAAVSDALHGIVSSAPSPAKDAVAEAVGPGDAVVSSPLQASIISSQNVSGAVSPAEDAVLGAASPAEAAVLVPLQAAVSGAQNVLGAVSNAKIPVPGTASPRDGALPCASPPRCMPALQSRKSPAKVPASRQQQRPKRNLRSTAKQRSASTVVPCSSKQPKAQQKPEQAAKPVAQPPKPSRISRFLPVALSSVAEPKASNGGLRKRKQSRKATGGTRDPYAWPESSEDSFLKPRPAQTQKRLGNEATGPQGRSASDISPADASKLPSANVQSEAAAAKAIKGSQSVRLELKPALQPAVPVAESLGVERCSQATAGRVSYSQGQAGGDESAELSGQDQGQCMDVDLGGAEISREQSVEQKEPVEQPVAKSKATQLEKQTQLNTKRSAQQIARLSMKAVKGPVKKPQAKSQLQIASTESQPVRETHRQRRQVARYSPNGKSDWPSKQAPAKKQDAKPKKTQHQEPVTKPRRSQRKAKR